MQRVQLSEFQRTTVKLCASDCWSLRQAVRSLTVQPSGVPDHFDITPGSVIGTVILNDTCFEIRPKVAVDRLLFMIGYAIGHVAWHTEDVPYEANKSFVELIAELFRRAVARATNRGLLHGYVTIEESMGTIRGRIRIEDQIRSRVGMVLPIEVRYNDFTADILENRILHTALRRLRGIPLRSEATVRGLRELESAFSDVSYIPGRTPPSVHFTRLNEHYRGAIELARFIIAATSVEVGHGTVYASSFLIDMNKVFEAFVHEALRNALRLSQQSFPLSCGNISLDVDEQVRMKPDLSWWLCGQCVFVGDIKYKSIAEDGVKESDLYQLLAYTTATNLESGILIYASGSDKRVRHLVRHANKSLQVFALDLTARPIELLEQINAVAKWISDSVARRFQTCTTAG